MGTCHLFHVLTVPPKKACLLCTTPAGMDWYIQAMPVGTYQVQSPGFPKIVYWLGIRYQETPLWPVCDLPCPSLTSLILPISLWRQQLFHCHLFLISTLSLLFPFLPISTLSTSACLWCLHSYLSYLFNSHLFLTLENSFRPGFCLSLTSVPPCLWPPFHPVWPPFHPVSDFHSVLSLTSLPPCLWPPFHPVSDLLLHTVSDLHSTLSLICLRLPVTSIPHLFFFFFYLSILAHLVSDLGLHSVSDFQFSLSLTSTFRCLGPPLLLVSDLQSTLSLTSTLHSLTSTPLWLTCPLLPVSDLQSTLSDFPFTPSQTSLPLPTFGVYACLSLSSTSPPLPDLSLLFAVSQLRIFSSTLRHCLWASHFLLRSGFYWTAVFVWSTAARP